ncbi:hypothetical protein D3C84_807880 [compost metagenome]
MIQRILIANHRAQMRAVAPDHPVAMPDFTHEGFGKQPTTAVRPVEQIAPAIGLAWLQRAGPRVIAHAVDLFRPVPAPCFRQALWITLVEQRHTRRRQRFMGRVDVHRQLRSAITRLQQTHQRTDDPKKKRQQPPPRAVRRVMFVQVVRQFRAVIGACHRGHGSHAIRAFGGGVTGGQ